MDIVDKLKSQIGDDPQHIFDHEALFKLAVTEIESLRSALSEIESWWERFEADEGDEHDLGYEAALTDCKEVACKALKIDQ